MRPGARLLVVSLVALPSTLLALEPPGSATRLERSRDGLPVVRVELGGETLRAALDTGTTRSMIAAAAARRLRLVPRARFEVVTATGPLRHALCAGPVTMRVDGFALSTDCLGWVPDEARLAGAPDVDLLLGADALGEVDLWLDLAGGRARFAAAGELSAWVRGERLPLRRVEARPLVEVELDGASLRLVLDSGADAPILFGEAATRLGGTGGGGRRSARIETAAGSATREALSLAGLRLGRVRLRVTWGLLLPEVADRREDGLLPLAALGPVLLDLSSGQLVANARLRSRPESSVSGNRLAAIAPVR